MAAFLKIRLAHSIFIKSQREACERHRCCRTVITTEVTLQVTRLVRIVKLAKQQATPVAAEFGELARSGELISYGPCVLDQWRRAAGYVDKIFKAAKPADLPVEQPTRFDLVINLKTAKVLGLTISDKLLALANKVIE